MHHINGRLESIFLRLAPANLLNANFQHPCEPTEKVPQKIQKSSKSGKFFLQHDSHQVYDFYWDSG
jgi:hypothetical protein